jgi:carbon-monoxide dehydrogenase small subunit
MSETAQIAFVLNNQAVRCSVPVRRHLVDFLRLDMGLTGPHLGCEHGVCGACHVRVDGVVLRGCLMLAVQADGTRIETIEGLSLTGEIADLQDAFVRHNALQCGFCTSGMLLTACELLAQDTPPDRNTIRDALSGNLCRCTGYQPIVDAIEEVSRARAVQRDGKR